MASLPSKDEAIASLSPSVAVVGDCPICYEKIKTSTILSCNHNFCHECIKLWLATNNTCPSCRTQLYEKDDEDDLEEGEIDESEDENGETARQRNDVESLGLPTYGVSQEVFERLLEVFDDYIAVSDQPDAASRLIIAFQSHGHTYGTAELGVRGFIHEDDDDGEHVVNERELRFMLRHRVEIRASWEWTARLQ